MIAFTCDKCGKPVAVDSAFHLQLLHHTLRPFTEAPLHADLCLACAAILNDLIVDAILPGKASINVPVEGRGS